MSPQRIRCGGHKIRFQCVYLCDLTTTFLGFIKSGIQHHFTIHFRNKFDSMNYALLWKNLTAKPPLFLKEYNRFKNNLSKHAFNESFKKVDLYV